jgi:prepilin-type N-terminal cleavage/methylation domain-containing protein
LRKGLAAMRTQRFTFSCAKAFAGFTLVELLVVIAIIGILMAMILPAVQSSRESGRRTQCKNQVKQLTTAMLLHLNAQKHFASGGWGWTWTGDPDRGFGLRQPGGWSYNILPYLEQQSLHDLGIDNQPDTITTAQRQGALARDMAPLADLVCPSRRTAEAYPRRLGKENFTYVNGSLLLNCPVIDYACNAGDNYSPGWESGPSSIANYATYNFAKTNLNTGISYAQSMVKDAHLYDGASKTYMLGERYLNPENYYTGLDPADDSGRFEGCAHDTYRWTHVPPERDRSGYGSGLATFGGPHAGIIVMSMCDGSIQDIQEEIDATVHRANGNRKNGN